MAPVADAIAIMMMAIMMMMARRDHNRRRRGLLNDVFATACKNEKCERNCEQGFHARLPKEELFQNGILFSSTTINTRVAEKFG